MDNIRAANLTDVEPISRIHAATWQEAYRGLLPPEYLARVSYERWLPVFTKTIVEHTHDVAVYPQQEGIGGLGGCVTYGPAREEEWAGWAEITAIYVLPQYWRQGLGQRLMRHALRQLKKQGYKHCYLWVLKNNERACSFYERMGFAFRGEEKVFVSEGQELCELRYGRDL